MVCILSIETRLYAHWDFKCKLFMQLYFSSGFTGKSTVLEYLLAGQWKLNTSFIFY